jgi:hypothetical protein
MLTFGVLAGEAANLSRGGEVTALTLGNWTLSAALLTALWGYALQRRIGNERYWRAVFWLVLFANSVMLIPVLLGDRAVQCSPQRSLLIVRRTAAAPRIAAELWTSEIGSTKRQRGRDDGEQGQAVVQPRP